MKLKDFVVLSPFLITGLIVGFVIGKGALLVGIVSTAVIGTVVLGITLITYTISLTASLLLSLFFRDFSGADRSVKQAFVAFLVISLGNYFCGIGMGYVMSKAFI